MQRNSGIYVFAAFLLLLCAGAFFLILTSGSSSAAEVPTPIESTAEPTPEPTLTPLPTVAPTPIPPTPTPFVFRECVSGETSELLFQERWRQKQVEFEMANEETFSEFVIHCHPDSLLCGEQGHSRVGNDGRTCPGGALLCAESGKPVAVRNNQVFVNRETKMSFAACASRDNSIFVVLADSGKETLALEEARLFAEQGGFK